MTAEWRRRGRHASVPHLLQCLLCVCVCDLYITHPSHCDSWVGKTWASCVSSPSPPACSACRSSHVSWGPTTSCCTSRDRRKWSLACPALKQVRYYASDIWGVFIDRWHRHVIYVPMPLWPSLTSHCCQCHWPSLFIDICVTDLDSTLMSVTDLDWVIACVTLTRDYCPCHLPLLQLYLCCSIKNIAVCLQCHWPWLMSSSSVWRRGLTLTVDWFQCHWPWQQIDIVVIDLDCTLIPVSLTLTTRWYLSLTLTAHWCWCHWPWLQIDTSVADLDYRLIPVSLTLTSGWYQCHWPWLQVDTTVIDLDYRLIRVSLTMTTHWYQCHWPWPQVDTSAMTLTTECYHCHWLWLQMETCFILIYLDHKFRSVLFTRNRLIPMLLNHISFELQYMCMSVSLILTSYWYHIYWCWFHVDTVSVT